MQTLAGVRLALAAILIFPSVGCMRPTLPFFAQVSQDQISHWQPNATGLSGSGAGWQLKSLTEMKPNSGIGHLVWLRDGKAFDLQHFGDSRGLEGYSAWTFALIDSRLYVYGPNNGPPRGWWNIQAAGSGTDLQRVEPPRDIVMPQPLVDSGVYQLIDNHLQLVPDPQNFQRWIKQHPGTYYIADPGLGVVKVFDLATPPH